MVHIVPHALELGISSAGAARVLATIGGLSILGKLLLGRAADLFGNHKILVFGFAFMAAALVLLIGTNSWSALTVFAVVFGMAYGGVVSVESPMVASLFGLRTHGLILGFISFGFTVGGALGPYLTGHLFDRTGSYEVAFLICVLLSVIGVVLLMLLKPGNDP
jgi:MFS family permease